MLFLVWPPAVSLLAIIRIIILLHMIMISMEEACAMWK